MEFEDLVEGWERSPLLPLVAMWRSLAAAGPRAMLLSAAWAALAYAFLWAGCLWAAL